MHHDGLPIDVRRLVLRAGLGGFAARWLIGIVLALAFLGCALVPTQTLGDRLPRSAGGVDFDSAFVVDDGFLSGHAWDDVLASLGKERSDASAFFRMATVTDETVGAVRVDGVDGSQLLQAFAESWMSAATVTRAQTTIGDRVAWILETRTGQVTVAYQRGDVVYLAMARDPALAQRIVTEGMP